MRTAGGEHQAGINHAAIVNSFLLQCRYDGLKNFSTYLLEALFIKQWCWGIGAHTTGVGTNVSFADAFVILGWRQQQQLAPVAESKD